MSKVIAHRGFSGEYPENTMLAFEKAVEAGCDGTELDIHLSKDGELIVMHDDNIKRTTNGEGCIREYTVKELKAFDASATFAGKYGFVEIPTLREYFEYIKDKNVTTNIEIKTSSYNFGVIEPQTIAMIKEFGLEDLVYFSSFDHYTMVNCKKLAPEIKCGLLCGNNIYRPAKYVKESGTDYWHPYFKTVTKEIADEAKELGVAINTWTVNTKEDMQQMLDLKIEGIITNYPDILRKLING